LSRTSNPLFPAPPTVFNTVTALVSTLAAAPVARPSRPRLPTRPPLPAQRAQRPKPTDAAKRRPCKAEGLVATAHKLIRILYGIIQSQKPYDEAEAFHLTPQYLARRSRNLEKQAAAMGFQLVEAE
jgi:hypothetical protein